MDIRCTAPINSNEGPIGALVREHKPTVAVVDAGVQTRDNWVPHNKVVLFGPADRQCRKASPSSSRVPPPISISRVPPRRALGQRHRKTACNNLPCPRVSEHLIELRRTHDVRK